MIQLPSELPRSDPAIYGLRAVYGAGEWLNLTCESGPSSPATSLGWRLGGVR